MGKKDGLKRGRAPGFSAKLSKHGRTKNASSQNTGDG